MDRIIKENLIRMFGCSEGDMQHHLIHESLGYDYHNGRPCMPAHFQYCPKTGRIRLFGNPCHQTRSERIELSQLVHGIYKVVHVFTPLSLSPKEEIVGLHLNDYDEIDLNLNLHPELSHLVLVETAKKFNKLRKKLQRAA